MFRIVAFYISLAGIFSCQVQSRTCTSESSSGSGENSNEQCTETTVDISAGSETSAPVSDESQIEFELSANAVSESDAPNNVVGAFSVTDTSLDDTFTYALVSGDGDEANVHFNIDGSNLRLSDGIEFDDGATRSIRVAITDSQSNIYAKNFNISVTEVKPNLFLQKTTMQGITQSVYEKGFWQDNSLDSRSMFDATNHRVVIPEDGLYLVSTGSGWSSLMVDISMKIIDNNGVDRAIKTQEASNGDHLQLTTVLRFSKGDWFEVHYRHEHTSTMLVTGSPTNTLTWLEVTKLDVDHGVRVALTSDFTVGTGTPSKVIPWDTEIEDDSEMHDVSTNNTRITIPTGLGGVYIIGLNAEFTGVSDASSRLIGIGKNGSSEIALTRSHASAMNQPFDVMTVANLSDGDYIEALVLQETGSDKFLDASGITEFYAYRLSDLASAKMTVSYKSDQTILFSTPSVLSWTNEQFDSLNGHDDSTNPERHVATEAGRYLVIGNHQWVATGSGSVWNRMLLNGAATPIAEQGSSTSLYAEASVSRLITLQENDYIEYEVEHEHVAPRDIDAGATGSYGKFDSRFIMLKLD